MKRIIKSLLWITTFILMLFGTFSLVNAQETQPENPDWWQQPQQWQQQWEDWEKKCKWVKLNTNFPIIWNCIWDTADENPTNAFPTMIWAITKIIMSLILVVCFIMVIYAGIQRASDNPWTRKSWWAKWTLAKVAITILLLWFSWAILRLINPNFFS